MTETTTTKAKKVPQLDLTGKPYFLILRQAETRNIWEIVNANMDADDLGQGNVIAHAREMATQYKTNVAVFGPQIAAFEPPAPPVARSIELPFTKLKGE